MVCRNAFLERLSYTRRILFQQPRGLGGRGKKLGDSCSANTHHICTYRNCLRSTFTITRGGRDYCPQLTDEKNRPRSVVTPCAQQHSPGAARSVRQGSRRRGSSSSLRGIGSAAAPLHARGPLCSHKLPQLDLALVLHRLGSWCISRDNVSPDFTEESL